MSKFTKDSILQGVENTRFSLKSVKAERVKFLSFQILQYKCQVFLLDIKKVNAAFWSNAWAIWSVCFASTLFFVDRKIYFCFKICATNKNLPSNLSQVQKSAFSRTFCIFPNCFVSQQYCLAYKHPYRKWQCSHSFPHAELTKTSWIKKQSST